MRAGEVSDSKEQRTGLIAAVDMDCFQDVQGDGKRITCVGSQEALKTLYSDLRYDKTPLGHQDGLRSCLDETQGECVRVNDMRRLSLQSTPRVVENIALSTRRL